MEIRPPLGYIENSRNERVNWTATNQHFNLGLRLGLFCIFKKVQFNFLNIYSCHATEKDNTSYLLHENATNKIELRKKVYVTKVIYLFGFL